LAVPFLPTTPLAIARAAAPVAVEVRSPSFTALPGTLAVSHVAARAASSNDYSSKIIRIPGQGLRVAVMPIAAPRIASAGSGTVPSPVESTAPFKESPCPQGANVWNVLETWGSVGQ
jgi:hypothetical protein